MGSGGLTANRTERMKDRQAEVVPLGAQFECLNMLARHERSVSEALSAKREADPGLVWFKDVDAVLRSTPGPTQLLALTRPIQRLKRDRVWRDFVTAAATDAREFTRLRRARHRLRSLWGVTPIISLKQTVAADRSIGVGAESLVFSSYYVTQTF